MNRFNMHAYIDRDVLSHVFLVSAAWTSLHQTFEKKRIANCLSPKLHEIHKHLAFYLISQTCYTDLSKSEHFSKTLYVFVLGSW